MTARPWRAGPMGGFDLETDGLDPLCTRILSAATVAHYPGQPEPMVSNPLINPGIPISPDSIKIHGITDEMVRAKGGDPATIIEQTVRVLQGWCEDEIPIIGMNLVYDFTLLDHECCRYGLRTLSDRLLKSTGRDIGPIIDILVIDRALRWQPGWGNRKLHQLAAIYGVPTTTLHDSAEDTKLSMRIAWRMAAKYPLALDVPAQVLHDQQRTWHKSWASEFTAYLAPKGGGPISPVWPVVRYDPAVGGLVMNGSAPAGTLL